LIFKIKILKVLNNSECKFAYRDSIFKNESKGKFVILNVTFKLWKKSPSFPNYPGVKKYFIEHNINIPTLQEIRKAIIDIRGSQTP
jgi:UDP-N-acetylmuramate dehydrogenase